MGTAGREARLLCYGGCTASLPSGQAPLQGERRDHGRHDDHDDDGREGGLVEAVNEDSGTVIGWVRCAALIVVRSIQCPACSVPEWPT